MEIWMSSLSLQNRLGSDKSKSPKKLEFFRFDTVFWLRRVEFFKNFSESESSLKQLVKTC